jgi:hypothetical protein
MTPLEQYPQLRKALYTLQWIANLALGILAVVFTAKGESPQWLIIAGLVGNFVWTYTGLTASGNVAPVADPAPNQD